MSGRYRVNCGRKHRNFTDTNKNILGVNAMTHEDRGHYARKHPAGRKAKPEVAEAVKQHASKGGISCAAAFKIAGDLQVPPAEIGFTLDALEIPIAKCQLGLYGYTPAKKIVKPAETVSQAMEEVIRDALDNDRLTCARAWEIAKKLGIGKMEVSSACEALEIKISSCQLGAF
jgi:hypothetical protein